MVLDRQLPFFCGSAFLNVFKFIKANETDDVMAETPDHVGQ